MVGKLFRLSVISAACVFVLVATAAAQDFQKSYRIGAGGQVRVSNVSGDVVVAGYDGDAIIVTATRRGRDRDMVEVVDRSAGNSVDISVRYPERCNCDASIKFEVQVPRATNYVFEHISSVSGDVEVRGVTGRVHASAVSGDVKVRDVSGSVNASAVSGDVDVSINRLDGADDMKFSSVSGDVSVRLPSSLDAEVDMSSFSGSIKTDFPIEVRSERYGSRHWARGRLGSGSRTLHMSSVSGDLGLKYSGAGPQ